MLVLKTNLSIIENYRSCQLINVGKLIDLPSSIEQYRNEKFNEKESV